MQLPTWLTWPLVSAKSVEDGAPEILGQLALADFVARGGLDRHLRRMRQRYEARRRTLSAAVREHLPMAQTGRDAAALHETILLPDSLDEPSLIAAAARRGVGLEGLSWHRHAAGGPAGFANLAEPALQRAVRRLADAAADIASQ